MKMRFTIWAVHIYEVGKADRPGKYLRTVDATFTESSGREFCKSFNACGFCGRQKKKAGQGSSIREERPGVVAVMKEHAVEIVV